MFTRPAGPLLARQPDVSESEPDVHEDTLKALRQLPCAGVLSAGDMAQVWAPAPRSDSGGKLGRCKYSQDRFAPRDRPLPISPAAMTASVAYVNKRSGLRVFDLPHVCFPEERDWAVSYHTGRHHTLNSFRHDDTLPNKAAVQSLLNRNKQPDCYATYMQEKNVVLFHPMTPKRADDGTDDSLTVQVYIHELVHAAQIQNFPDLALHQNAARNAELARVSLIHTPSDLSYFGVLKNIWKHLPDIEATGRIMLDYKPIKLLTEGHASWVEHQFFCEFIVPRITSTESDKASLFSSIKAWIHPYHLTANVYTAGRNMISAVEALQQELEQKPFENTAGQLVHLDPVLKGHGLTHLLFKRPEMVMHLLPNYNIAWRRYLRERADVTYLREYVRALPGHMPVALKCGTQIGFSPQWPSHSMAALSWMHDRRFVD